ncbi:hypothetical protein AVEN_206918-1 [Araneus ventricosus]|uniref:Uncharacterized protein n=1 Tax=Araneus ventricosus TaxID=182803 RepID=A0A4Y2RHL5_ARAVE|nr:hypothetical protein AVEN_206918-1 [Araneus ventricosus]
MSGEPRARRGMAVITLRHRGSPVQAACETSLQSILCLSLRLVRGFWGWPHAEKKSSGVDLWRMWRMSWTHTSEDGDQHRWTVARAA